jgi:hypothetical protein
MPQTNTLFGVKFRDAVAHSILNGFPPDFVCDCPHVLAEYCDHCDRLLSHFEDLDFGWFGAFFAIKQL